MIFENVKFHMSGRSVAKRGAVQVDANSRLTNDDLGCLGINLTHTMDALLGGGGGQVPGYIHKEHLATWLPGTLRAITSPQTIDDIVGITTIGSWVDEEIRIRTSELSGGPEVYGDHANIPLADMRTGLERRGVLVFELGFDVGKREEAVLSAAGYKAMEDKRRAVSKALEIGRNEAGYRGFRSDTTNLYGLLNDPNLSEYRNYSDSTGGGTAWNSDKIDYDALTKDFNRMVGIIENQMGVALQASQELTLVLPLDYGHVLSVAHETTAKDFGTYMREKYPNIRVLRVTDFTGAGADGVDVAYLIAENVDRYDGSDVDGATLLQLVPARYHVLGSENRIKSFVEDAVSATAGVFVLRPWAVARYVISGGEE